MALELALVKKTLTLFDPAHFGPFKTQGGGRSAPKLFPKLLEGDNCSKNWLKIKFPQKSSDNDPV